MGRHLLTPLVLALTATVLAFTAGAQQAKDAVPKTAKERQAGKAYDPQRVNDCNVPVKLRGDTSRSADCGEKAKAAAKAGEAEPAEETSD